MASYSVQPNNPNKPSEIPMEQPVEFPTGQPDLDVPTVLPPPPEIKKYDDDWTEEEKRAYADYIENEKRPEKINDPDVCPPPPPEAETDDIGTKEYLEITFRKLDENDSEKVFSLIDNVLSRLPNPEFFYPYEKWEKDSMFDPVNYAHIYGAFIGDQLVGMAQLYILSDMPGISYFQKAHNLPENTCCELGGCLVLPEYRGHGIATELLNILCKVAEQLPPYDKKGLPYEYIFATTHPDNIAAIKAIEHIGLVEEPQNATLPNGYYMKIYSKKIA